MAPPIVKRPAEQMPLVFDFSQRLGGMARGAKITAVTALTVAPTGDENDLAIGTIGEALIDHVSGLAVQVRAIKGRVSVRRYVAACEATVSHAGATYQFIVELPVHVR